MTYPEKHRINRSGWLRAAVLGANDGIVSTASLIVGVAAAGADARGILIAGLAGLVAGAMSMAAGEYVSVSSQADIEKADLAQERKELAAEPEQEQAELAGIYQARGLEPALAREVARQLMSRDALAAHARDELGITEAVNARPFQAALTSALTFSAGAALPLLVAVMLPLTALTLAVSLSALMSLAVLGYLAAHLGGAAPLKPVLRVVFWGAAAMLVTYGIGALFDVVI
ncbi:VIT family protein [Pseudohongiella sp. O18]|uniref:VIT1/CCC1 transporter family protein n=1 Tax=Pseudohongiella sp. O18 TaxID=2904248 RepID=UPI001F18FA1E|nr:VIT family protein [Pseudohongiella sp. O18]